MANSLKYNPEQGYLLPPTVREVLGEGHLCFFVQGAVEKRGLQEFEAGYSDEGHPAYHPALRLKVWLHAYALGMTSWRWLEQRIREDLALRYLARGAQPDFCALNEFRKRHGRARNDIFTQVVEWARSLGLGPLSMQSPGVWGCIIPKTSLVGARFSLELDAFFGHTGAALRFLTLRVDMRIDSKAPTRVDLAGGTLDIWPIYLFHPGAVTVNAAITRYASCRIETQAQDDVRIRLVSRDTQREESFESFSELVNGKRYKLPLLAEIVKFFQPRGGFVLTTDSEAPAGAGIGGSSAMAVAICAALDRYTGTGKSKADWIHISRDAEAIVIRVPTGTQDHYPPAFGGAAAIELPPGGERRTELRVDLSELERRLVLCYTGKPRKSAINNWDVFRAHINGDKAVFRNLARISEVAQELRGALESSNWLEVGRLMREEWSFRKRNLPNITTKTIDRIVDNTRRKGALAGKVCGAGGGGCVVLLIEPETRERVEAAVAEAGGEVLPMKLDRSGVQVNVS